MSFARHCAVMHTLQRGSVHTRMSGTVNTTVNAAQSRVWGMRPLRQFTFLFRNALPMFAWRHAIALCGEPWRLDVAVNDGRRARVQVFDRGCDCARTTS